MSVRLLSYDLRTQLDALDLETYLLRVGQLYGSHTRVYLTIDRMPAFTVKDCENIIARLHAVPAYVDQDIAILNEAIERGVTQPKIVADLVTEQLKSQVAQDAAASPLLEFLKKMPSSLPEAERARLRKQATEAFENDFRPAWRKYLEYMQTTYAAHVRPSIGVESLKNGKEDYAILIRRLTTTSMTPQEIHKIGLAEVDRIDTPRGTTEILTAFDDIAVEAEEHVARVVDVHVRVHARPCSESDLVVLLSVVVRQPFQTPISQQS